MSKQIYFKQISLALEMIHWVVDVFFLKFQIIFGLILEFIFEVKILQEDLLVSLMERQVLAFCYLYLFKFSYEGACFEFPESCLIFSNVFALLWKLWFIVVWGIVLLAKCFKFLSYIRLGISVVKFL